MKTMRKYFFFCPLIIFIIIVALSIPPTPGVIMMMVGGPALAGLALWATLIALTADAVLGRLHRAWILLPTGLLAGYYYLYYEQDRTITETEVQLKANNPGPLLAFDPQTHSLVAENADQIVKTYKVPVAFSKTRGTHPLYYSHTLHKATSCETTAQDKAQNYTLSYAYFGHLRSKDNRGSHRLCLLRARADPPHEIVEMETISNTPLEHTYDVQETKHVLKHQGKPLGEYRTAYVNRYAFIPFPLIGCTLISASPSWRCFVALHTERYELDTFPVSGSARHKKASPIVIMLGLERYSTKELMNFDGYEQNASVLAVAQAEPQQRTTNAFDVLKRLSQNPDTERPFNFAYLLASDDKRLNESADLLVDTFLKLLAANQRVPLRELSVAIAALPEEAYRRHAADVFAAIRDRQWWNISPALYVRAADVGEVSLPHYVSDLRNSELRRTVRFAPVLAICRIGTADAEVISHLKREFETTNMVANRSYYQALFVTLLALGEQDFAGGKIKSLPKREMRWYKSVLRHHNRHPDRFPNNCVARRWPGTEHVAGSMAGLVR